MNIEEFRSRITGFDVDHAMLTDGSLNVTIDLTDYPLSQYRAMYIRVGEVTEEVLDVATNLELVATCGSGYDHIDIEAATAHGVTVTHTPQAPAPGVVEHTIGFLFSLLHELPDLFEQTAAGHWVDSRRAVAELEDRTVGVVGLGTIGSRVATLLSKRFNCDVIAYDPYVTGDASSPMYPRVEQAEIEAKGISFTTRRELFKRADIVTLHVPLSDATDHMVDAQVLELLKGGYLINTSRGEVIDESALIQAMERDLLKGVALDVMEAEPPADTNPLLEMSNVYVTPHVAGGTKKFTQRSARINARRIRHALRGEEIEGVINPQTT
jgi:D-3-phosphoglycerate dehydrogenase